MIETIVATCGCVCDISDMQTAHWPRKIIFCPLHSAEPRLTLTNELVEALKNEHLDGPKRDDECKICRLIARAEKSL